ncbi:MAG: hypothetical protein MZV64_34060 [Ignavibacteriales bacterium]|nr:hypothetical protein [Ignavibacteriales bacterium]
MSLRTLRHVIVPPPGGENRAGWLRGASAGPRTGGPGPTRLEQPSARAVSRTSSSSRSLSTNTSRSRGLSAGQRAQDVGPELPPVVLRPPGPSAADPAVADGRRPRVSRAARSRVLFR